MSKLFEESRRPIAVALLASLCAVAAFGYWLLQGVPQPVPEGASDRIQCASYAPFRKVGETPFNEQTNVSEERLMEDLKLLSGRTGCVRTYSVQQGLDAVPRVAQSLGMKVMLGVWLGRDRLRNETELARGIALANQFPGTVSALIVGNEVLLRRELPEAVLGDYLQRAGQATAVPVTYADVWEFWMEHQSLSSHVSFVTIHILPYWEDDPVAIDLAIEHIVMTAEEMRKAFDGKDILIGETGWPSAGRTRRAAVASRVNQARFFRQFSAAAAEHGLRYNFIEAFDQPWKRRMEGAMGGQWGLFNSEGEAKFPATGPVEEDPRAERGVIAAAVGLLLFILVAAARGVRGWQLVTAAAVGAVSGAVLMAQWRYMVVWNRYWTEWAATGVYAALAFLFAVVSVRAIRSRSSLGSHPATAPVAGTVAAGSVGKSPHTDVPPIRAVLAPGNTVISPTLRWLSVLRVAFLFGGAAMALLLVFDARYRGFPWPLYALPLMSLLLLLAAGFRTRVFDREEAVLASIILVCGVAIIPLERLSNVQALMFCLQLIALAGASTGFRYWRLQPASPPRPAPSQTGA